MEEALAPSIAAFAVPSAAFLLILAPMLVLGGVCGRRRYSNTSDVVLSPDAEHGTPVEVDISALADSRKMTKASEEGSDSSKSMQNRFQGPALQDALYGVAQPPDDTLNAMGSGSTSETYKSRFARVSGSQVLEVGKLRAELKRSTVKWCSWVLSICVQAFATEGVHHSSVHQDQKVQGNKEVSPTAKESQNEREKGKAKVKPSLRRAVKSFPALGTPADGADSTNVQHDCRVMRYRGRRSSLDGDSSCEEHKTCPTDQGRVHRDDEGSFYMPPDCYGPQRLSALRDSSNGRTHILPAEVSVKAVQAALHEVCDKMNGYIKPGKQIVQSSIRIGVDAVVANVETVYGAETVLLFADKNKKRRQIKLHEQAHLRDVMPMITSHDDTFSHETDTAWATLPSCIFVNKVLMLSEHLSSSGMKSVHEMFDIWLQLAKVLREFHARGWYLHHLITFENVVMTPLGRPGHSTGWTLLELGSTSRDRARERKESSKPELNPRHTPPELAQAVLDDSRDKLSLNPTTDMWMFGMLVYQVMTGEHYWPSSLKSRDVLNAMLDPTAKLPHEERPVLPLVQELLSDLLHSDPLQRISSSELVRRLEKDMPTAVHTVNAGPIVMEEHIVLPGLGATVQPQQPDARAEGAM